MYKTSELREKSREELLQLISELKGKLLALRFENATGSLAETHLPKATKKDIALVFTVLKEKELGIEVKTKEAAKPASKSEKVKEEIVEETKVEEATPVAEATPTEVKEETTEPTQAKEEEVN